MDIGDTTLGGRDKAFPPTSAGLTARFAGPETEGYRDCLSDLARRYWKPVYTYLRIARSRPNEEAKDLTQAFFLRLLEDPVALRRYAPERCSFRTYLKTLLRHFLGHENDAAQALRRGGGVTHLRLDDDGLRLEDYLKDPRAADPERVFDQAWAVAVMKAATDRMRERLNAAGREAIVRVFEAHDLAEGDAAPSYAEIAERLALTEGQVRRHLHEARRELQAEIRFELSRLTGDDAELEKERRELFGA